MALAEGKKWRADCLSQITKTIVMDKDFKNLIENDKVFTCEKHFKPEDIEICKYCNNDKDKQICYYVLVFSSISRAVKKTTTHTKDL